MPNSVDTDQSASEEAKLIWIYTVCKGKAYPSSAGPALKYLTALRRLGTLGIFSQFTRQTAFLTFCLLS